MRIYGKVGAGERTCKDRKRSKPTKAEKRLQRRIESYNTTVRLLSDKARRAYRRPGSLQAS